MEWIPIVLAVLLGFYMAWNIGANDVANSMADAVGSHAISVKGAVIAAGLCNFAGATLVGSHVADTVRKGIVDTNAFSASPALLAVGMGCALLGASIWLHSATWFGLPVSTTHSIVGAVAGFGVVAAGGLSTVQWGTMGQIVASWFVSPVAGALLAYGFFKLISWLILGRDKPTRAAIRLAPGVIFVVTIVVILATFYKGMKHVVAGVPTLSPAVTVVVAIVIGLVCAVISRFLIKKKLQGCGDLPLSQQLKKVEKVFAPMVVITSCSVAFAHGSNDVGNAVGPLAAILQTLKTQSVAMKVPVPLWLLALGGGGIVVGLATYGYRVMMTVGRKITQITPSRGVAADIAASTTVLICSRLKLPVSTTHTLVGAILGIGLARGLGAINSKVVRNIFGSWLITVPAAGLLSGILFFAARHLFIG